MHAHLDCFSGAAGDMLLAAVIDAALDDDVTNDASTLNVNRHDFIEEWKHRMKHGLGEIAPEWDVKFEKVWRGSGRIAARKVHVTSVYQHESAPIPISSEHNNNHTHTHKHHHGHHHEHSHHHGHHHEHDHCHSQQEKPQEEEGEIDLNESLLHDRTHYHVHSSDQHHSHHHKHSHSHNHNHSINEKKVLRNFSIIRDMIEKASIEHIPQVVKDISIQTFGELAKAESATHGCDSINDVHFHEVGAIDSIIDTVGTVLALHMLDVTSVSCSRLPMGEGVVWTDHGLLPVPAPATLRLLKGLPTCPGPRGNTGELVTPTAAALIRSLTICSCAWSDKNDEAVIQGRAPGFIPLKIGIGAGSKDFESHPNILRILVGTLDKDTKSTLRNTESKVDGSSVHFSNGSIIKINSSHHDMINDNHDSYEEIHSEDSSKRFITNSLIHMEANIDDCSPEILAYTAEMLLEAGALDAWTYPITMKKGRLAHCLNCICSSDFSTSNSLETKLLEIIFRQTTTFGIRIHRDIERRALFRRYVRVAVSIDGEERPVNVKIGMLRSGEVLTYGAEYEDCKTIANEFGVSVADISFKAIEAARK